MLKQDIKSTRTFSEKDRFALSSFMCHPNDLSTCFWDRAISVFMKSNFWRIIGKGCANRFILVSSQPNVQLKKKSLLRISSLLCLILIITLIWQWLLHWRTHGGSYVYDWDVAKNQYHKLENCNMTKFFQHWRVPEIMIDNWVHKRHTMLHIFSVIVEQIKSQWSKQSKLNF